MNLKNKAQSEHEVIIEIEYEDIVDEISIDDSLQNDMILSISQKGRTMIVDETLSDIVAFIIMLLGIAFVLYRASITKDFKCRL